MAVTLNGKVPGNDKFQAKVQNEFTWTEEEQTQIEAQKNAAHLHRNTENRSRIGGTEKQVRFCHKTYRWKHE